MTAPATVAGKCRETPIRPFRARWKGCSTRLTGQPVELHGSGRTDAGVHALGQVANVKLPRPFDPSELLRELNRYLPADIGVIAVEPAPERFHARLNAHSKTYRYRIWNSEIPNVLERSYLYPLPEPLDVAAMERAAADLVGTHDFRSFCGLKRFKKSGAGVTVGMNPFNLSNT